MIRSSPFLPLTYPKVLSTITFPPLSSAKWTLLEEGGYLTHERDGRRNVYRVRSHLPLRHPLERKNKVAALLALAVEVEVDD